ncbi:reverse transcriptase domain-containing protein [Tanacetum coccineum]
MSQSNQQVNVVNPSFETCGGPHHYFECQATGGFIQWDVYAATGNYNAGGNSYNPQGNHNLLSYSSNNYLGPPGFNQANNLNLNKQNFQNRNNQNQYQNRSNQGYQNQGFNQNNRGQNFNQGNNYNQNQGFNQNQGQNFNQNQAQTNFYQTLNFPSTDEILSQHMIASDAKFQLLANQMTKIEKAFNERPQGALPSNTIPNPREDVKVITTRSGITLDGPLVSHTKFIFFLLLGERNRNQRRPKTRCTFSNFRNDTARVPSPVIQPAPASKSNEIPERNPYQPPIPYPSRLNKDKLQDKSNIQIHKFLQMFKKLHFNISFAEALAQMPKYAKMLKDLLTNKEKLLELASTPLNKNCSALEECLALADLGSSINLMPLSVWKKLMLPELIPTLMTLELANQSVAYPVGIAEDVLVQVGKFTFPADFVVVDYDVDPCVPLILGIPFLRTTRALVDVHGEELSLRVGDEKLIFNVESTSKYPHKHGDDPTPSSDPVVASLSPSLTPFGDSDFLLEETDAFLSLDDSIPPEIDNGIYYSEGYILFLEKLLSDDPTKDLPPKEIKNDETKTTKSSTEEPPELELKDLPPHLEYAFLEGTSKLPVIIAKDLKREEKDQLNSHEDIDDLVPIPRVSEKPLDSLDSISKTFDMTITNPLFDFNYEFTLNSDNPIFDIQNEESDESKTDTIKEEVSVLLTGFSMIVKTTVLVFNPPTLGLRSNA